jgi:hypothetical protein
MFRAETVLLVLLRFGGLITLSAAVFVFVPFEWMQRIAVGLTLAEPAETPLNHYLTRSLSAMYAVHGALVFYLSFDVARYAPVARFAGAVGVAMGAMLLGIDLHAGMPTFWTAGEGPFVMVFGAAIYVVADRVCRTSNAGILDKRRPGVKH